MVKLLLNRLKTFTRNAAIAAAKLSLHVRIPSGYTSIEDRAFYQLGISSVTIPDSVTSIGYSAFTSNQLTSVAIPDSVTSIGDSAFADNQLTSITIPDSVTSIGDGAFYVNQLTSITLPDSITSIGAFAFASNQLTSVTIPDSVTSIGNSVFDASTIVTIESSSTYILPNSFHNLTLTRTAAINGTGNILSNVLTGNSAANTLNGSGGNDSLNGSGGNDSLNGGRGKDSLTGSTGVDRFIYTSILDSRVGSTVRDVITDFNRGSSGEKIDLSAIDAYTKTSGNQAFVYIGSKAFTGTKGEVRFSGGVLQMNTGTDKIADMEIALTGVTSFSQNFLVL